jgi:hypothetical protein
MWGQGNGLSTQSGIRSMVSSFPLILCFPFLMRSLLGDLIYLNAAGQPVVIINSQKVAVALLDRRAEIYSDRPRNIAACDIMTGGLHLVLAGYGET